MTHIPDEMPNTHERGPRAEEPRGLIPADRFRVLHAAAELAAGDDLSRAETLREGLDRLVEPLLVLQDLPGDAAAGLRGSPAALDRLTTALVLLARSESAERMPTPSELLALLGGEAGEEPPEGAPGRTPFFDDADIGLAGVAAAYAGLTRPEAADRIEQGLGLALAGMMPLDLLWALAPAILDRDGPSTRLFGSTLEWMAELVRPIGPDDPWLPPLLDLLKVIPFDRREWLERVGCIVGSFERVRGLKPLLAPYTIASIVPAAACPGQTVTITGSGFGSDEGTVSFPTIGGTASAQVTSWADGRIEVVVPQDATCGDIRLLIPAGSVAACGNQSVDVVKPGSGNARFDGGSPHILRFTGNGGAERVRVDPSSALELAWKVCPSNAGLTLVVREAGTGAVLTTQTGLSTEGTYTFQVPAYTTRKTLECTLEASGQCPPTLARRTLTVDVASKPNVKIEGIEVTQGIQRFWRQNVTPNSVATIAGKDTIVRVYVSADMGGFNNDLVPGIWGVLSVGAYDLYPINGITPTNPGGGQPFFTARNKNAIDRTNVDHTLNFRIPAAACWGTKSIFCYLVVPGPGGTVAQTVGFSLTRTWDVEPSLKVRWVRITDNRQSVTPTTPTDAQARETVRRALELLPFPPSDIAPAPFPTHATTREFTQDGPGAALRMDIDNLRAAVETLAGLGVFPFDKEERWIGLTVPWFRGWGAPKTCVAPVDPASGHGERIRAAHELGHTLGLCHLHDESCFKARGLTAEPTLEDVAFDPHWNRTFAGTNNDFMSYTTWSSSWITSLNWDALRAVL